MSPIDVLGLPVTFSGSPGELLECLAARYRAFPHPGRKRANGIALNVERNASGWTLQVGDRQPRSAAQPEQALKTLDDLLLKEVIARRPGQLFAHAAMLAIGGCGVVLPGLSRTGKTILALALLQAGARLLSDEVMVLDPENNFLQPLPRALRLSGEITTHFPDLSEQFLPLGESRILDVHALGPAVISPAVPLSVVVVPDWEPSQPDELKPIGRQDATSRLLEACVERPPGQETTQASLDASLVGAQTWSLRWREPHGAASLLMEALAGER